MTALSMAFAVWVVPVYGYVTVCNIHNITSHILHKIISTHILTVLTICYILNITNETDVINRNINSSGFYLIKNDNYIIYTCLRRNDLC